MLAAIDLQALNQAAWKRVAGPAWQDSGLVVTTRYGTPYEPRNFNRHFAARCKKAGVRYVPPHVATGKTCAKLLTTSVHPRIAMRILRHGKIAITMEIYTDVLDEKTRDALGRLGETFGS